MFCTNCGRPLEAGSRFCPACGQPVPGGPVLSYGAYVNAVAARLGQAPAFLPELGCHYFFTTRFSAALNSLQQHFFLLDGRGMDGYAAAQFSEACFQYVSQRQNSLLRLVKAPVVYSVICQEQVHPQVLAFVQQEPPDQYAAFRLPVLAGLSTGRLHYFTGSKLWGCAMLKGIRDTAERTLAFPR